MTDFKLVRRLIGTSFDDDDDEEDQCLGCDVKFGGVYILGILRQTGFIICKETCAVNPECHSFDFYVPKDVNAQDKDAAVGTCVMNRVDLKTLQKRRELPIEEALRVSKEAMQAKNASRCLLFNKIILESKFAT